MQNDKAERDALEEQMQDREMLVMLLLNAERQRDAALAVIEKARGMFQNDGFHESPLGRILSSVPADVLRERDAEKWDEGWEACADDDYAGSLTVDQRPNPHRTGRQS